MQTVRLENWATSSFLGVYSIFVTFFFFRFLIQLKKKPFIAQLFTEKKIIVIYITIRRF